MSFDNSYSKTDLDLVDRDLSEIFKDQVAKLKGSGHIK